MLEDLLPTDFDDLKNVTYIEPFVGGGAMLFHMLRNHKCIKRAVINDINPDLIHCYELIAKAPKELIERLKDIERNFYSVSLSAQKDVYYAYRTMFNSDNVHPDERAAILIFLNHTCFNGLFRVNSRGKFNVPFGRYKHPVICNEELIMADHRLLSSVELIIRKPGDYKLISRNLSRYNPNFIYFDPPYRPLSVTSSFRAYSNSPFGDVQQEELRNLFAHLSNLGCLVMLSNSDSRNEDGTSYFEGLYAGYDITRISAPRFINARAELRQNLSEIVIFNY